jgi:hypothetical protein
MTIYGHIVSTAGFATDTATEFKLLRKTHITKVSGGHRYLKEGYSIRKKHESLEETKRRSRDVSFGIIQQCLGSCHQPIFTPVCVNSKFVLSILDMRVEAVVSWAPSANGSTAESVIQCHPGRLELTRTDLYNAATLFRPHFCRSFQSSVASLRGISSTA